jgi:hypothetical protein
LQTLQARAPWVGKDTGNEQSLAAHRLPTVLRGRLRAPNSRGRPFCALQGGHEKHFAPISVQLQPAQAGVFCSRSSSRSFAAPQCVFGRIAIAVAGAWSTVRVRSGHIAAAARFACGAALAKSAGMTADALALCTEPVDAAHRIRPQRRRLASISNAGPGVGGRRCAFHHFGETASQSLCRPRNCLPRNGFRCQSTGPTPTILQRICGRMARTGYAPTTCIIGREYHRCGDDSASGAIDGPTMRGEFCRAAKNFNATPHGKLLPVAAVYFGVMVQCRGS